jgi:putative NADPH-quinone reductase
VRHILVIDGNPDPAPERLTSALALAYLEGAESSGCIVRSINIGSIDFPILRKAADFCTEAADSAIKNAQDAFLRADHIVFVYPLWLGGPPALLKAFMEQVARNQFLLRENKGGFPVGGLKGRSACVIVTMGMPALLYRTLYGAHGVKAFNRSILNMAGLAPVRTSYFGGNAITQPNSAHLVEKVRDMGRRKA